METKEQLKVEQGNKLIADFMGVVFHDDANEYYDWEGLYIGNSLRFNISWDWLMPVVEKIETLEHPDFGYYTLTICGDSYIESESGEVVSETTGIGLSKLHSVYETVVKFIQWYNENKK